jgi:DNA-directed RNA polymerase alpha subunit
VTDRESLREAARCHRVAADALDEIADILDRCALPDGNEDTNWEIAQSDKGIVEYMEFSTRALTILKRMGIVYLSDLADYSAGEVRAWRQFGERSFREISDAMAARRLRFKGE